MFACMHVCIYALWFVYTCIYSLAVSSSCIRIVLETRWVFLTYLWRDRWRVMLHLYSRREHCYYQPCVKKNIMVGIKSPNVVASGDPRATEGPPLLCIIVYRCVYSTSNPGIAWSAWFGWKKKKLPCDRRFSAWLISAMVPSLFRKRSQFIFLYNFFLNQETPSNINKYREDDLITCLFLYRLSLHTAVTLAQKGENTNIWLCFGH